MTGMLYRRALLLVLCCSLCSAFSRAQHIPWIPLNPTALEAHAIIDHELQQGAYASAMCHTLGALHHFSDRGDQLGFLFLLAHEYTTTARWADALACLKYCQRNFAPELRAKPEAHALLMESFADIAIEVQLTPMRQKAVELLVWAYTHWGRHSKRAGPMARKIAVLYRFTKNNVEANKWYAQAEEEWNGCADRLRLLSEEASQAKKDGDSKRWLAKLNEGAALIQHCDSLRQEDIMQHHLTDCEYWQAQAKQHDIPWEFLQKAEASAQKIVDLGEMHPEITSQYLASGLVALANIKVELGDLEGAHKSSKRALEIQLKRGVAPKSLSSAYESVAQSCHYLGRLEEALQYYRLSMLSFPTQYPLDNDPMRYTALLANYGQELIENGEYLEGERYMKDAIAQLLAIAPDERNRLGTSYLNLAVSYERQDCSPEAAEYFQRTAEMHQSAAGVPRHTVAQARIGAATHLLKMQNPEAAQVQLKLGLAAIHNLPAEAPISKVFPLLDLANFYRLSGDLDAALRTNHALLRVVLLDFKSEDIFECPDLQNYLTPWYTLEAVDQKMGILWEMYQGNHDAALLPAIVDCGQKALVLLRKLRQERNSEDDKLSVNQKWRKLFEKSLQAVMELYERTQNPAQLQTAFEISEQSKAMMLMEAIVENSVLDQNSATADLALQRRNLQSRMNLLRRQIGNGSGDDQLLQQQQQDLLLLQQQLDALQQQVQSLNPKYFDLVYRFDIVQIAQLQRQLAAEDRALVEFFYGENVIYTMVVNADTLVVRAYGPDAPFKESLAAFTQSLQTRPDAGDVRAADAYLRRSHIITEALWKPIAALLPQKIVLIPDGPLSYISFDALVHSAPEKETLKFKDLHYFLEEYTISYHYSATFFSAPAAAKSKHGEGILAMAPVFEGHKGMPPLPESVAGVEALGEQFEDLTLRTGEQATKAEFLRAAPTCKVIDLATHGKYDKTNFLDSRIYFTADGSGDSLLYLRELYTLNLPAQLAILEACETGLGDYHQGEGVMSLARGFTYAGCESVLMSLWQVPDGNSTHSIIQGFYANLADAQPRDEAIAQSKRAYLQALRAEGGHEIGQIHPYYWSELVLIGDEGPITIQRRASHRTLKWIGFISLMTLGALGIFWMTRRRRARSIPPSSKGQ